MLRKLWNLVAAAALLLAAPAWAESYVVFDVPGAVNGVGLIRMNGRGDISGDWQDAVGAVRAFVRSTSGAIVTYEVPGATYTYPYAINDSGVVVGSWATADGVPRGFIRTPDGGIRVYDVPGSEQTSWRAINAAGDIAGMSSSSGSGSVGVVLHNDGSLTTLGAISPHAINDRGDVAGQVGADAFVRTNDGSLFRFGVPGATDAEHRAQARAINRDGTATGYAYRTACGPLGNYCAAAGGRSFIRGADGSMTVFAVQRAGRDVSTQAMAINTAGTVVGISSLGTFASRGFIRAPDGQITSFNVPGMATATATAINDAGMIAGVTTDASGWHGYLRLP